MGFRNPVVAGSVLVRPAIQSPNYSPAASGWTINGDGTAEFNNLTYRGTFSGTSLIINAAGAFFYNGTPGAGNLLASITSAGGTDQFGNAYHALLSAGNQNGAYTRIGTTGIIHMANPAGSDVIQLDPTRGALLMYSGAPAVGNLIASLASAAGTDAVGNAFPQGLAVTAGTIAGATITGSTVTGGTVQTAASGARMAMNGSAGQFEAYDSAGHLTGRWSPGTPDFTQLNNSLLSALQVTANQIYWANITAAGALPTPAQISAAATLTAFPDSLTLISGTIPGNDSCQVQVHGGVAGGTLANGPYVDIGDTNATTPVAGTIAGAWRYRLPNGTIPGVQTPSYGTNWAGSTTFNTVTGNGTLQFWQDAQDQVQMTGNFKAGATAPSDPVFILPAGYWPKTDWYLPCLRNNAGTLTAGFLRVSNNGHVDVLAGTGSAVGGILANNEWLVAGSYPLGNLP